MIPTVLACLVAAAGAAADGPRGHTLGADTARLAPGAAASRDAAEATVAVSDAPACGAAAAPGCPSADEPLDR
jgi:hypothetical protein